MLIKSFFFKYKEDNSDNYLQKLFWLICVSVIIKIFLSFYLELGNDEVYYYTYAIQPDWNHFDHPGMVGWMIRITTLNLNWVSDLSLRIGSIISSAYATYIIFKITELLKNQKAGFIAACFYSLSIYTSIIAGLFVMPDSPQLLFFTISIYLMIKFVMIPDTFSMKHWILLGVFIGLTTLSKIHGLYLWIGFISYIFIYQKKTLQTRNIYLSILITILFVFPILLWNIENNFITYRFHSKRVMHTGFLINSFLKQIGGEILYQNPFIYFSILLSFINYKLLKSSFHNQNGLYLLLFLSLPLIFTFWILSMFNPTLPHWSGPGYIALFILSGIYWSENFNISDKYLKLFLKMTSSFLLFCIIGLLVLVYILPRQLGSKKLSNLGEYNPINDITGWSDFSNKFSEIVKNDIAKGKMKSNSIIVIHKWFPGSHVLFYIARPLGMQVHGVGSLEDLHKFAWLNNDQNSLKLGNDAYFIVPSNLPTNPFVIYSGYFDKICNPDTIDSKKRNILLRKFYVYRLKNCKKIPKEILK